MATIKKRGRKSFQARIRRRGYPTLTRSFDSKAEAERWARTQEHEIDRGGLPATLEAERTTLANAIDDYRRYVTPKHKGAETEASRLRAMARCPMGSLPLAQLTFAVIESYIQDRMDPEDGDGVKGSTVNRELGILTQVLKRARKRGWMIHDPMLDVERPKNPPGRERRLETDERDSFEKALKKTRNRIFKMFIMISHDTGMRRGELLNIEWSQVNFQRRMIRLHGAQTKTGAGRAVPLTRFATALLRCLRRRTGKKRRVFEGLTADAVKKCWQRLCRRADVEDFRLHDLRHERVSSLIDAGWNVINAMAVSGHKDMKAFRGYAHPRVENLVEQLDALDSR